VVHRVEGLSLYPKKNLEFKIFENGKKSKSLAEFFSIFRKLAVFFEISKFWLNLLKFPKFGRSFCHFQFFRTFLKFPKKISVPVEMRELVKFLEFRVLEGLQWKRLL
jgi:hypothetical protein